MARSKKSREPEAGFTLVPGSPLERLLRMAAEAVVADLRRESAMGGDGEAETAEKRSKSRE